jgi:putative membrane-bound dehydrogenase-like protein
MGARGYFGVLYWNLGLNKAEWHRMHRWLVILGLMTPILVLAAEKATAPLPADKAARDMRLPDGFRTTVFAAEPDVVQPISFCIDARGRVWVAEALNYGTWQATGKDRIVILEDRDGTGRASSRKVFYEGLNYITGIEVGFGGVWVVSPPKLYFIPDRDGDDRPDGEPEVVFDGFGYRESRHNLVNGFTWGPDGWLYGGHGRTSPSDVGPPGTPAEQRIHCDGGVFRIHPTRRVFENFADGTTNPWGVDFDDFGQCFVSNCVNPHLFHMIQGGHYEPWRNRPSSLYAYERLPTCADHLHFPSGKPGEMRGETPETLAMGGGHAHCGTLVYLGDRFPDSYRNTVMLCNIHGRRINHDLLQRKGSGYTASHGKDFMISADPWFMGVTLRTGPDGNVFVSDWSDTGECHTYKPNRETGRIYKISHGEPDRTRIDLARLSDDELVKLQLHRNDFQVRHARRLLQERAARPGWKGTNVHAALRSMLASEQHASPQRLRALWALHVTGGLDEKQLLGLLDDRAEHLRAWAIQLLCEGLRPPEAALTKFRALAASDSSPVVRLYLACALQRLPVAQRWEIAGKLLGHAEDAEDANLPLMYWYGIEPLVPADPGRAVRLAVATAIPRVRQFLGRRVVEDAVVKGDKGDLQPLVAALLSSDAKVQLDLLQGAREGLRGRKSLKMPEGWPAAYARLTRGGDAALREHAVVLALIFGDPQALRDLRQTVQTPTAAASERQTALMALIEKHPPDLAPMLHDLLADRVLRRQALQGLAAYAHTDTPRHILARYAELTPEEKQDALATLAARRESARQLLEALEKKVVVRSDVSAYLARQLYALGDREVTDRLRAVWGDVRDTSPQKQEQIARYKAMLTPTFLKKADLGNGRLLFQKTCQQCHKLYGEGSTIGPDLTGSNRSELEYLLSNLVDPSAEVGRDYRMSIVATENGRLITGIIVERTPARLIVQTATQRIVLAREDVESIQDSPLSMMPEKMLDALSKEQVRDLIAYLAARTQVPLPAEKR